MLLNGVGRGNTVRGTVAINRVRKAGDILVTDMTTPAMLDQMLKAGAVVTNQGGAMCHAALNCLEFGIPFVVGTENATAYLKNGDTVEVNPTAGTVELIESQA